MTRHRDFRLRVQALVAGALPAAELRGFDGDSSAPEIIPGGGLVLGLPSDPGEPEVDLSPIAYNFRHDLPLDVAAPGGVGGQPLDDMVAAIGAAVALDRTLGGLCDWLDLVAPAIGERTEDQVTITWAEMSIVGEYSCASAAG